MKNDCLFCAIVDNEIEAYKIYEDDYFCVILDRFPKCVGHSLILPKRHAVHIFDLNEEEGRLLFPLAQKVAAAMRREIDFVGLNILQNNGEAAGQEIMHFHLHLIPRYEDDDMAVQYKRQNPSPEDFEEITKKLIRRMEE